MYFDSDIERIYEEAYFRSDYKIGYGYAYMHSPPLSKILPNKNISFSKPNDDNLWDSIIERKSDSKYLFYRTRIQFYPRHKYSLEVDQDLGLPTSPEFFKRRFKQMKFILNL